MTFIYPCKHLFALWHIYSEQERALFMAEEAKAPVDRRNSWGGIAERSPHLVIKLSVHLLIKSVLYSYEGGQEERKAVAGVESDWDPRPLAAI